MEGDLINLVLIPVALGLLGFVEPCSVGSSLLFVNFIEGHSRAAKISQAVIFMTTRAVFFGALGAGVAFFGTLFIDLQKAGWLVLGSAYLLLGIVFLLGRGGALFRSVGVSMARLSGNRGSAVLGVLFGLNIPACAAPLIFALLGAAAIGTGATAATGFFTLALFGLALSAPLVATLFFASARRALDRLAGLSVRMPNLTGLVFVALGFWSIYFGLFVNLEDWNFT